MQHSVHVGLKANAITTICTNHCNDESHTGHNSQSLISLMPDFSPLSLQGLSAQHKDINLCQSTQGEA